MTPSPDATALDRCRAQIEVQLGWGKADTWTTSDFEELSLRIREQTGRAISSTTLKRLWGRVSYDSRPSRHSLDTLACFLGYASWRAFTPPSNSDGVTAEDVPVIVAGRPPSIKPSAILDTPSSAEVVKRLPPITWVVFGLLVIGVTAWVGLVKTLGPDTPIEVAFHSRPVATGVPNTVIFEYNVEGVKADSFFIQQSWDRQRRRVVSKGSQTYTSIYYHPGFFNAKLVADDRTLAEHPVHVTTRGWIALIDSEPTPIYFTDAISTAEGSLSVSPSWLKARGHDATASHQVLEYYNVQPFDVQFDGFSLETILRRTLDHERYPCGRAEIAVLGERGAFEIPLGNPGCVSEMGLLLGMRYFDGETNDLSAFGIDLAAWQQVGVEVKEDSVRIQLGSNIPFVAPFDGDVGEVVGLRFRFEGAGAIDHVSLRDPNGEIIYDDAFQAGGG